MKKKIGSPIHFFETFWRKSESHCEHVKKRISGEKKRILRAQQKKVFLPGVKLQGLGELRVVVVLLLVLVSFKLVSECSDDIY